MKPRERRDSGQGDLLRSRLDAILDMDHQLVALAHKVDWGFLEKRFGEVYRDGPGQPPLPTRLMAGLTILKYTYDLSDEELCARWVENPYYQFFCGEEFFQHELVLDRSSLTRWRQRMGEERMNALLQESLSIAVKSDALKPSELSEVIIDTTVEPKNVMFPTDARLLNRAREILVRLAKRHAVVLRQSYARVGKFALIKHQRYAHAKQFKRANRALKTLRTYLGRVIRDVARKVDDDPWLKEVVFKNILARACFIQRSAPSHRNCFMEATPPTTGAGIAGDFDRRVLLRGSGLRYRPVPHTGNQNSSPEEAEVVRELVDDILASKPTWINRAGDELPLTLANILIVAPYNAQVFELKKRLPNARIGTVDKFQGQEAPLVIYSMTTSSHADAPRGMEFLYSLNRLNVATSRAMCVCVLVASP